MASSDVTFVFILLGACIAAYSSGKLTLAGTVTGAAVATGIYAGTGLAGVGLLAIFFVTATIATSWKKQQKRVALHTIHETKRDAFQVLANGGTAAVCGLLAYTQPDRAALYYLMLAGSLASATSDTLSSELGVLYGRKMFNIITLKPDRKGSDGVISAEGTLIGVAGAALIAVTAYLTTAAGHFWLIVLAGTAGNLLDSVLGATLERRGIIRNNTVNLLSTAFAALFVWTVLTF